MMRLSLGTNGRRAALRPLGTFLALMLVLTGWSPSMLSSTARAAGIARVGLGLGDTGKVGAWVPIRIELDGGPDGFTGTIEVEAPDADGTPTVWAEPLTLKPGAKTSHVLYTRPGTVDVETVVVRLRDAKGRAAGPPSRPSSPSGSPPPRLLDQRQEMIVTLGKPRGVSGLSRLGAFQGPADSSRPSPLAVAEARDEDLSDRAIGLDAASVLVLDANDPAAMASITAHASAILDWVREGGHLVVTGTTAADAVRQALGPVLPAVPTGVTRLNDLGELESFAGSKTNPIPGEAMAISVLAEADTRGGRVLSATATAPLIVRGPAGFGRVTIVGIDTDREPFTGWKDQSLFWVRALDLKATGSDQDGTVPGGGGAIVRDTAGDLSSLVHRALDRPPGVWPVPFAWVAFAVLGYILLIGPIDYLFLKHVARRMQLTWVTFPLIVALTTAGAYAASYALKGTGLKLQQLDVVDLDQTSGEARGTTLLGLFSPSNHDYDLTVRPTAPGLKANGDDTDKAGARKVVSWFGPAEAQLGGGGVGRLTLSAMRYRYEPAGRAESVAGTRVPVWSTKAFQSRWSMSPGSGRIEAIESDLAPVGSDRLEGTIVNHLDQPIKNAVLVFGNQVYDRLGTIAPGALVRVDAASRVRPVAGYLEERTRAFLADDGTPDESSATTARSRAELDALGRVLMFRGAMNPKTPTPPSVPLRHLDLTGQLAFDRPMLVGTLDRPVAAVALDPGAGEPQGGERLAIVRVILPLAPPAAP
jgi:hypothetical protein